jgi:hypothetical protein
VTRWSKREKKLYEAECITDYDEAICRDYNDRLDYAEEEREEE